MKIRKTFPLPWTESHSFSQSIRKLDTQNKAPNSSSMEEQELDTVLKKFGRVHPQQQSTLFDQFERLSFEIQLNQAILRRSLSESAAGATAPSVDPPPPPAVALDLRSGLKKAATTPFRKAMRKLFRPFVVSKRREMGKSKDATSFRGYCSKRFSNSVRV